MNKIFQPIKFLLVFVVIISFLLIMSVVWLCVRNRWRRVKISNFFVSLCSKIGCSFLGIKVNVLDQKFRNSMQMVGTNKSHPNVFLVGNHLSYVDILVICSTIESCFVTSMEIKETPLLGQICQMAGCLFVERRNKTNILKEVADISEGLEHGLSVSIFPESTSSNGEQILRFRKPLYSAAIQAKKYVVPFCLNYRSIRGEKTALHNRDNVFWYGDMPFASHLWKLCASAPLHVDFHLAEPLAPENKDATQLAEESYQVVLSMFTPVLNENNPEQQVGIKTTESVIST